MTGKILKSAAVFGILAVVLTIVEATTIKNPKPPATLEWNFFSKDPTLDTRMEIYRFRLAVAVAFEAFLLRSCVALAVIGALSFLVRWIRGRIFRRRGH